MLPGLNLVDVKSGDFNRLALSEQLDKFGGRYIGLESHMIPIGLQEQDREALELAEPPPDHCLQVLHFQHYDAAMTHVLARALLREAKPSSIPEPMAWSSPLRASRLEYGAYVVDIALQLGVGTVDEMQEQSQCLVLPVSLAADEALFATALHPYCGWEKLLAANGLNKLIVAGINLHVVDGPNRSPSLVPVLRWEENGERLPLGAMWSNQSAEQSAIPLVVRVQSLEELKRKLEEVKKKKG